MVLSVNLPKDFNSEAKILYLRKNNNLILEGYGCYNSDLEKCRSCSLQSFKRGDFLDIDDIKNNEENGCSEMSNSYFSLKFDSGKIKGIRFY